jgi:hypothetical protein
MPPSPRTIGGGSQAPVARLQMSSPLQSALVVQSCIWPIAHLASHFDDSAVMRVAGVVQHTPVAQLFVPEHANALPLHMAVSVHASRPFVMQQTCVAESHAFPLHAICPVPPSVPRGGVVVPPPGFAASVSGLASSPVAVPLSSPPPSDASSPTPGDASSPTPPPLLLPVAPELLPVPELLPAPELLAVLPELVPPEPPSPSVVAPEPLQPTTITIDAPRSVRKADIEVPPRTYFAVSSAP